MSRVHDALRRAEQTGVTDSPPEPIAAPAAVATATIEFDHPPGYVSSERDLIISGNFLSRIKEVPFTPSVDSHLIDISKPHEAPSEEFRTLRTRLNHLQSLQPISTLVVTSPSPAEGKSFAAVNLALAEAQLANNPTLLIDCDFRRPIAHSLFQIDRAPGMTDYLLGKCKLEDAIHKIAGTGLYVMP